MKPEQLALNLNTLVEDIIVREILLILHSGGTTTLVCKNAEGNIAYVLVSKDFYNDNRITVGGYHLQYPDATSGYSETPI